MFLSEPPRTQADVHFTLFGIPVRIHPLFWLVAVLLGPYESKPVFSLLWLVAILLCIVVHEMGHAVVMRVYGYWPSIVLHGFGGLAIPQGPGRPGRLGQILISAAGPGAGFLLAAILALVLVLTNFGQVGLRPIFHMPVLPFVVILEHLYLTHLLNDIFWISVMWGLVNLLPVYPLDGGHIAQEVLVWANPRDGLRQSLILSVIAAVAMIVVAVVQWQSWWTAVFFGYLAYMSYTALRPYGGRGPW